MATSLSWLKTSTRVESNSPLSRSRIPIQAFPSLFSSAGAEEVSPNAQRATSQATWLLSPRFFTDTMSRSPLAPTATSSLNLSCARSPMRLVPSTLPDHPQEPSDQLLRLSRPSQSSPLHRLLVVLLTLLLPLDPRKILLSMRMAGELMLLP